MLGTATTPGLLPLLAVTLLRAGPGWIGLLTASAGLPRLLIGLPAGAWLDRLDSRAVMIVADLVAAVDLGQRAAGLAGLPQPAPAAGRCAVGRAATVFFRLAFVKLLALIVSDQRLEAANAWLFGTESAMQLAGPGLAGLLTQLVSGQPVEAAVDGRH